jgi:UDP-3-O-[3-hydroxymyristoyl] glucosamine N-acyltransferase
MSTRTSMSQQHLLEFVRALGVDFSVEGEAIGELWFCSLRDPRPHGIYFVQGLTDIPPEIEGSVILVAQLPETLERGNAYVRVKHPQLTYYKLQRECCAYEKRTGVHSTAIIHPNSFISPDAYIGPYCVIENDVFIGPHSTLDSHVVVKAGSRIGARVRIESHSTIGATGVAWAWDTSGNARVVQPQTGSVEIGDDVFLGSDISIVRGSINEATRIGKGGVIAHGSKIGHGCLIADYVHMANNVSIGGNVDIGEKAFFGSGAIVRARARIADGVVVGAGAVVIKDALVPGDVLGGNPARSIRRSDGRMSGVPGTNAEG